MKAEGEMYHFTLPLVEQTDPALIIASRFMLLAVTELSHLMTSGSVFIKIDR